MQVVPLTGLPDRPLRPYESLVDSSASGRDKASRLVGNQIADVMGWNREEVTKTVLESQVGQVFRGMLFARVVPNLKRLGLISPRVREAFERLQIIQFEDFNPEEQDRQLGLV